MNVKEATALQVEDVKKPSYQRGTKKENEPVETPDPLKFFKKPREETPKVPEPESGLKSFKQKPLEPEPEPSKIQLKPFETESLKKIEPVSKPKLETPIISELIAPKQENGYKPELAKPADSWAKTVPPKLVEPENKPKFEIPKLLEPETKPKPSPPKLIEPVKDSKPANKVLMVSLCKNEMISDRLCSFSLPLQSYIQFVAR